MTSARQHLHYQSFAAVDTATNEIVGTLGCQQWEGPCPTPQGLDDPVLSLGTVWGVYTAPSYRRRGIATTLMRMCVGHWREIGCKRGILVYASDNGRRVYERLGFYPGDAWAMPLTGTTRDNS
jgi:GNAT superfamily N-acetyltransferase